MERAQPEQKQQQQGNDFDSTPLPAQRGPARNLFQATSEQVLYSYQPLTYFTILAVFWAVLRIRDILVQRIRTSG